MIIAGSNDLPSVSDAIQALQSFRDGIADTKYGAADLYVDDGPMGGPHTYGMSWSNDAKIVTVSRGTFNDINAAANVVGDAFVQFDVTLMH